MSNHTSIGVLKIEKNTKSAEVLEQKFVNGNNYVKMKKFN